VDAAAAAQEGAFGLALDLPDLSVLVNLRGWVRQAVAGVAPELMIDLELVCTELASNALEHADGPRRLRLIRRSGADQVRVEVDDASPDLLPTLGVSRSGPDRGRGLQLVNALARWGVHRAHRGKTVWAELPTP
jgi:anti-sigma regulatory factor (Ser/Thr protein kinase)